MSEKLNTSKMSDKEIDEVWKGLDLGEPEENSVSSYGFTQCVTGVERLFRSVFSVTAKKGWKQNLTYDGVEIGPESGQLSAGPDISTHLELIKSGDEDWEMSGPDMLQFIIGIAYRLGCQDATLDSKHDLDFYRRQLVKSEEHVDRLIKEVEQLQNPSKDAAS